MNITTIVNDFGLICLVASLLMRILPDPAEINWKAYTVIYNMVRRASLNTTTPGGANVAPKE